MILPMCSHPSESARPPIDQTLDKVLVGDGCWTWTGWTSGGATRRGWIKGGYGVVEVRGVRTKMHRAYYEAFVGPIPEGLQLDHLCRNRKCVRPSHLEPVTSRENTMRGAHPNVLTARSGRCKRGHNLAETRVYKKNGWSNGCRECVSVVKRSYGADK